MDTNTDPHPVRQSSATRRPFHGRRGIGRPSRISEPQPQDVLPSFADCGSRTAADPHPDPIGVVRWSEKDDSDPVFEYSCLHYRYRIDCF